jgi:hypothetical protein
MKVGIIAPIKFLDRYCITNIQYCLPSLLVTNVSYRNFHKKRKAKGNIIILDCRKVAWKRKPEDFEVIGKALELIIPDIIIAPSYMFNSQASSKILKEFVTEFPSISTKVIKCLEGASEKDLLYFPWTKELAVPSHMYRYLSIIKSTPNTIYIENHLNLEELSGKDGILVTSLPIRLGLQGRLLSDCRPSPNSLTFFEEEDKYEKITRKNVEDTIEFYEEKDEL